MWSRPSAILSWDYYLGESYQRAGADVPVYAAPARATDLGGLPPAYISTMEFDPLRDEGLQYGLKLLQSGVSTEIHSFPRTFHGSSVAGTAEVSQREYADTLAVLRRGMRLG
jgi:acetyl esterase/lipase